MTPNAAPYSDWQAVWEIERITRVLAEWVQRRQVVTDTLAAYCGNRNPGTRETVLAVVSEVNTSLNGIGDAYSRVLDIRGDKRYHDLPTEFLRQALLVEHREWTHLHEQIIDVL